MSQLPASDSTRDSAALFSTRYWVGYVIFLLASLGVFFAAIMQYLSLIHI